MIKKPWIAFGLLAFGMGAMAQQAPAANTPTVVHNAHAKGLLLGAHRLTLQWIEGAKPGEANVTDADGSLQIKGEQHSLNGADYVRIDGVITQVDAKSFAFQGTILTQVAGINNGQLCKRDGTMNFRIAGARKFWRLQQMQNPCVPQGDTTTDYVDIFLR